MEKSYKYDLIENFNDHRYNESSIISISTAMKIKVFTIFTYAYGTWIKLEMHHES